MLQLLIICQWFPPEYAPIGVMLRELAEDLVQKGHSVTIITGYPNYPSGVVFDGYKKKMVSREKFKGINILRCYLYTSPHRTFFRRVLNFLTFGFSSLVVAFGLKNQDLLYVVSPPLTNGMMALVLKRLKGMKYVFNVQDIYPDVAIATGHLQNPLLIKLLQRIEKLVYHKSEQTLVISEGFKANLISKGVPESKIAVVPNWIDTYEVVPISKANTFSCAYGLEHKFVVLYSGTIGIISGAKVLLDTAALLSVYQDIIILFVGEGVAKAEIMDQAKQRSLNNIRFFPLQPREHLSEVQSTADVSIVTMQRGKGKTSVPSKVLGYMAAARPVIACVDVDSDTADLILKANCGLRVEPDEPEHIANGILELYRNREKGFAMGENGRQYLEKNYTREIVTARLNNALINACREWKAPTQHHFVESK